MIAFSSARLAQRLDLVKFLLQQIEDLLGLHGGVEEETLGQGTTHLLQYYLLLGQLYSFDDHLHAQIPADIAHGSHQCLVAWRVEQAAGEGVVHLDVVHRIVEEGIERTATYAEVIHGNADAPRPQLMEQVEGRVLFRAPDGDQA